MVRDSLDAFVTGCSRLPYEVIKRDDEVDDLTVKNFEELLSFMSSITKLEMSGAKMPFCEGGHNGRKGYYHVKSEGVKTTSHYPEGS